eukprot:3745604-Prymnesium_polylepis.1
MARAPGPMSEASTCHSPAVTNPPTLELRSGRAEVAMPVAALVRLTSFRRAPVEVLSKSSCSSSLDSSHLVTTPPSRRSGIAT